MIYKVLRIFVNILTTDGKYSVVNRDILRQTIQIELAQKDRTFSQFDTALLKCRLTIEHFQKKMTFIADLFPKLRTPKNVVSQISKKSRFIGPFDKRQVSGTKHCWSGTAPPLPYLLITVKAIELVKISLCDMQKSWECLLTYWLLMTSILFFIETI